MPHVLYKNNPTAYRKSNQVFINKVPIAYIWADFNTLEQSAKNQIYEMIKHPRLWPHLAIMPDVHAGIGATIGSVIPLRNAIIPSAVGTDIGCGVMALKTNLTVNEVTPKFKEIHMGIKRSIPLGFNDRNMNPRNQKLMKELVPDVLHAQIFDYEQNKELWNSHKGIAPQMGTLGSGNHFIELCKDKDNVVWAVVHSGSRNIGYKIAERYTKLAKEEGHSFGDLSYFDADSERGEEYLKHMRFAVDFAYYNRKFMIHEITLMFKSLFPNLIGQIELNIPHNFVAEEFHYGEWLWIHRKGAVKVPNLLVPHWFTRGIIPGSMGSSTYIVEGRGNEESFNSCSHGAGRVMSRSMAKGKVNRKTGEQKTEGVLKLEDFKAKMAGIYSEDIDSQHIDESPDAYKDIDKVMENQKELVVILEKLEPIFNIKG